MESDEAISRALREIDPGNTDRTYWVRFHSRVVSGARRELARRRMLADLTVSDLLAAWARALVPAAGVAAALASVTLARSDAPVLERHVGVEALLVSEVPEDALPTLMWDDEDESVVAFAAEVF
jgi:hypothetical protein